MKMNNHDVILNSSKVIYFMEEDLKVKDDFEKIAILEATAEGIKKTLQAKSFEDIIKASLYNIMGKK